MRFQNSELVAATFRTLDVLNRLARLRWLAGLDLRLRYGLAGLRCGWWHDARAGLANIAGHGLRHLLSGLWRLARLNDVRLGGGDGEEFLVEADGAGHGAGLHADHGAARISGFFGHAEDFKLRGGAVRVNHDAIFRLFPVDERNPVFSLADGGNTEERVVIQRVVFRPSGGWRWLGGEG